MEQMLRVGIISSTHGIKGEVKVFPTTDDNTRFKRLQEVILDNGIDSKVLEIEHVKFFKNMVILKFKGFDTIEAIEGYKGKDLLVSREHAVKLAENENFIVDMIGLKVLTDDGVLLGNIKDIMLTGANDVYVVEDVSGKELLIPAIKDCVLDVDLEKQIVLVHILDGLLDLN